MELLAIEPATKYTNHVCKILLKYREFGTFQQKPDVNFNRWVCRGQYCTSTVLVVGHPKIIIIVGQFQMSASDSPPAAATPNLRLELNSTAQ